jgi:hypothetical protein
MQDLNWKAEFADPIKDFQFEGPKLDMVDCTMCLQISSATV